MNNKTNTSDNSLTNCDFNNQANEDQAQLALIAIRDNLLHPMHDSLSSHFNESVNNASNELKQQLHHIHLLLSDILIKMENMETKINHIDSKATAFLKALTVLKWES